MNEKQSEVATTCAMIIGHWIHSNDFSSPTNASDIGEFISPLDISDELKEELTNSLSSILLSIKKIE